MTNLPITIKSEITRAELVEQLTKGGMNRDELCSFIKELDYAYRDSMLTYALTTYFVQQLRDLGLVAELSISCPTH